TDFRLDALDQSIDARGVGHVTGVTLVPLAGELDGDAPGPLLAARDHGDPCAPARERLGDRAPDPSTPAGDERYLTGQFLPVGHRSPWFNLEGTPRSRQRSRASSPPRPGRSSGAGRSGPIRARVRGNA